MDSILQVKEDIVDDTGDQLCRKFSISELRARSHKNTAPGLLHNAI